MICRTSHRDLSTSQGRMRNKSADLSIPLHLGITDVMRLPYTDHKKIRHSPLTNSEKEDISVKKKTDSHGYLK
jgi:hypothetical protein